MKRTIFLSLPMKDRENKYIMYTIDKMKTVIRAMYPEDDLTFIDNFSCSVEVGDGLVNGSLLYLGKAIEKMAYCDHIARIDAYDSYMYRGCDIELHVARDYGMKIIELVDNTYEIYCPDIYKKKLEEVKHDGECCCNGEVRG